jgi:hypothetical protein
VLGKTKGVERAGPVFLVGFPLLLIPLAIYNMIAFLTPGVMWTDPIVSVQMVSGAEWTVTLGDGLIALALLLLFVEILKATRAGARSIVDHLLSTAVFIAALVEFLLVARAATSTFALLTMICLLDVIAGYSVSIRTAQRDLSVERVEP